MNDNLMVKDHFETLLFILAEAKKNRAVSVELIQEINAGVLKSTGKTYNKLFGQDDSSKGMFRKGNVSTGISYFPNFEKIDKLTKELVVKISDKLQYKLAVDETVRVVLRRSFFIGQHTPVLRRKR